MFRTRPLDHLILILGALFLVLPVLVAFMTSTHTSSMAEAADGRSRGQ